MDRQPVLESERLLLRPLTPDDWDALYSVAADPLVWEVHPAHDRWQEPVFHAFFDEALAEGGALLAIRKADGRAVGSSQFRACPIEPDEIEIGWTFLARECWGTGLNPEMKRLMLGHALAEFPRVLFRIGETNVRSRKAIEAVGGQLTEMVEDGEYKGVAVRHVVYEIDRAGFATGPLAI
jgi:RimJ/RimL family protein N-acetyltransferase